MARKTATVVIGPEGGRDAGKTFFLTEMPAAEAEDWALQALLALGRTDVSIPPDIARAGLAGVATLGLKSLSKIAHYDLKPLLAKVMECVQFTPDPSRPEVRRAWINDDIEEVMTFVTLRYEVFKLQTGFSMPAGLLASVKEAMRSAGSATMSTSPAPSGRSSRRGSRR